MSKVDTAFWSHVERSEGCWVWNGATRKDGYGHVKRNNRFLSAHRHAYELTYGPIPEGLLVLHTCDNRRCVRPDHLWLGSHRANTVDMVMKRRAPGQVLGPEQVRDIRHRHANGSAPCRELASGFGVSVGHMQAVVKGRFWSHLASQEESTP